mgnify:CR=1 FL=1
MRTTEQTRLIRAGAVCICAGLVYGYLLIPLGLRLRCPFRALTGLRCPGCGVTDLCLAVLHGRFWEAPAYNWGANGIPAGPGLAGDQPLEIRRGRYRPPAAGLPGPGGMAADLGRHPELHWNLSGKEQA